MKKLICLISALLICLSTVAFAAVKVAEPNDDFYYLDQCDALSKETEAFIYYNNKNLQEACGGQIVVAAINTLSGLDIDDYAYRMFDAWGIGDKKKNNGLLILLVPSDENYYVAEGTGTERFLSVADISEINYEYLESDFDKKRYDAGVTKVFGAYFEKYVEFYGMNLALVDGKTLLEQNQEFNNHNYVYKEESSFLSTFLGFLIFVLIVYLIFVRPIRRRTGGTRFIIFPRVSRPRPAPRPRFYGGRPGGFGSRPSGGFSSRPSGGFSSRSSGSSFSSRSSGGFGGAKGGGGHSRGSGAGRR